MRISAFIDGFNVYHSLDDNHGLPAKPYARYKWIDYWKLSEQFVPAGDALESVHLFTAYCPWSASKRRRHRDLVSIQEDKGVQVKIGYFRPKTRTCRARGGCHLKYGDYEEKRTDVNVATQMLSLATQGKYDKAILFSGDSDYRPVIEEIRFLFPRITIISVLPIKRSGKALRNVAHHQLEMKLSHLKASRLSNTVYLRDGTRLDCPIEWA